MKLHPSIRFAAAALLGASLLSPTFAQGPRADVPFFAIVETIEFKDMSQQQQKLVLERIGLRVGDMLTADARQRIGLEIGKIQKGSTFTYKAGSKPGTAKLIISAEC